MEDTFRNQRKPFPFYSLTRYNYDEANAWGKVTIKLITNLFLFLHQANILVGYKDEVKNIN